MFDRVWPFLIAKFTIIDRFIWSLFTLTITLVTNRLHFPSVRGVFIDKRGLNVQEQMFWCAWICFDVDREGPTWGWEAFRCCSLFLLFVDMSLWAGVRQALFGQVHTSHQNTYHSSQLYKETGKTGRVKRKDGFQHPTVILLLRLDGMMPSRQTQKNLPLMKYDVCKWGAAFNSAACNYILE